MSEIGSVNNNIFAVVVSSSSSSKSPISSQSMMIYLNSNFVKILSDLILKQRGWGRRRAIFNAYNILKITVIYFHLKNLCVLLTLSVSRSPAIRILLGSNSAIRPRPPPVCLPVCLTHVLMVGQSEQFPTQQQRWLTKNTKLNFHHMVSRVSLAVVTLTSFVPAGRC